MTRYRREIPVERHSLGGAWTFRKVYAAPERQDVVGITPQCGADSVEAVMAFLCAQAPGREEDARVPEVLSHARPDPARALRQRAEELARYLADQADADDLVEHAPGSSPSQPTS
ncbi:hypothetical protein ACFV6M_04765 [Streptomyces californicus]|uniref:hypothetical protein n=1 Tax=Streptomyces TaxID=1883 RepID=UPI001EF79337|nr:MULTISPECIES: hypothetical protein [Streptomyces]